MKIRVAVRTAARVTAIVGVWSGLVIVGWEQIDDQIESYIEEISSVTYVSATSTPTPTVSVDAEIERKKEIFDQNIKKYWEDTTQQYLKEQLDIINAKMKEVQPMDQKTYEQVKEQMRRTEVSL